jgi:hypothetical protein
MDKKIINLVISHKKIPHEDDLVNQLKELVYSYAGKMSTAAAFGCIEIAKIELSKEVYENN